VNCSLPSFSKAIGYEKAAFFFSFVVLLSQKKKKKKLPVCGHKFYNYLRVVLSTQNAKNTHTHLFMQQTGIKAPVMCKVLTAGLGAQERVIHYNNFFFKETVSLGCPGWS
jgi:hypothetical protein